jgi:putative NADPH-quinone reductase
MHALIVFVHPEPRSFNGALKNIALDTLTDLGWTVEISDLYAEGFNPAAGPGDVRAVQAADRSFSLMRAQRLAATTGGYTEQIEREQHRLARADLVIFQFPIWWYSVPAMLKGWFDRVLTHGFAYDDENLFEDGFLRGKRALVSLTTGGSADELHADADRTGTPEDWLRAVQGGTLGFVGMQVLPPFIAFAPKSLDEVSRRAELVRWKDHLTNVIASSEPERAGVGN